MHKIRLGLIGAGSIARKHLEIIKNSESMDAAGITSRTILKAQQIANGYNIPIVAENIDDLVCKVKPDALMVLVSADQMYRVVREVLPYKLPLFIEKPPGLTPEQNLALLKLAKKYNVPTMVGFNRRYYSIFHKGLEVIKQQGKLLGVFVEGHERIWLQKDTGKLSEQVLLNWIFANSTHTIDLLRFFGGEPQNIKAISHNFRDVNPDQFAAVMELENGAIGQYSSHWYSPGGWRVVLYGDGVTVEFRPLEKGFWTDKNFKTYQILPDEVDIKYKPGFYWQMEAFAKLVRTGLGEWPMLDLEGAYKTMILAEKISLGAKG